MVDQCVLRILFWNLFFTNLVSIRGKFISKQISSDSRCQPLPTLLHIGMEETLSSLLIHLLRLVLIKFIVIQNFDIFIPSCGIAHDRLVDSCKLNQQFYDPCINRAFRSLFVRIYNILAWCEWKTHTLTNKNTT